MSRPVSESKKYRELREYPFRAKLSVIGRPYEDGAESRCANNDPTKSQLREICPKQDGLPGQPFDYTASTPAVG